MFCLLLHMSFMCFFVCVLCVQSDSEYLVVVLSGKFSVVDVKV